MAYELVKLAAGDGLSFTYDLARFEPEEDPFGRGLPPYYLSREQEEIPPDDNEEADTGNKRRAPRLGVRWTIQDSLGGVDGALYHGRSQSQPQGSAFLLMAQSRENRRQIHVMPLTGWVAYDRVANAVEVPASVKEAELLMKKKKGGVTTKKRKNQDGEEVEDNQLLSRRQRIERLVLKSLKGDGEDVEKKSEKGGARGGNSTGRKPSQLLKEAEEAIHEGLAQAEDTKELLGIGEDNEDEYEFQDDEEDLADVNNYLLSHELNEEDKNDDEDEDEDEEEHDGEGQENWLGFEGDEADAHPVGATQEAALSSRGILSQMEQRFERPVADRVGATVPGVGGTGVGVKRRPDDGLGMGAGLQAVPEPKRQRLTLEPGSLQAAIRERLVGLGGRVKMKEMINAIKDLIKDKEQSQEVRDIIHLLTSRDRDPVDNDHIFTIRPEYARK